VTVNQVELRRCFVRTAALCLTKSSPRAMRYEVSCLRDYITAEYPVGAPDSS